jgi:CheY-like chemotaxis protein
MSSDPSPIRILSVDDHPLIRKGIAGLLATQADMNLIAEAANGREAIQQFHRHRLDITLMDLQMPEMSGLDAIIAIRGEFPEARIIVLTTYAGDVRAGHLIRCAGISARTVCTRNSSPPFEPCAPAKSMSPRSPSTRQHATDDAPPGRVLRLIAEGMPTKRSRALRARTR